MVDYLNRITAAENGAEMTKLSKKDNPTIIDDAKTDNNNSIVPNSPISSTRGIESSSSTSDDMNGAIINNTNNHYPNSNIDINT